MKNLENYGVQELNTETTQEVNGGTIFGAWSWNFWGLGNNDGFMAGPSSI